MFDFVRHPVLGLVIAASLLSASAFGQSGGQTGQSGLVLPRSAAPLAAENPARKMSIDEAVALALEQNLSLQVQRLAPQLQDLTIAQVRSAWTPTIGSTIKAASSTTPSSSAFSGAVGSLANDNYNFSVQADQFLPWGATYNVTWLNTKAKSTSIYQSPNPELDSQISASYTQPLLRNFRIDSTRQQLLISKKNRDMTDLQLRQTVLTTVRAVKNAYWNLAYALENLKVQQQSLEISRESLRNNKSRVSIGTMAPIDIIEAEAEVARNEETVIVAEADISRAEDALRQLIFDPKATDLWNVRFELTDPPVFRAQDVDLNAAVKVALEKRTDLVAMRKQLEADDINVRYFKNQLLPDLNVKAGYGLTGQGGSVYDYNDAYPPVPYLVSESGWGTVMSRMMSNDHHNWSLALTVGYPIGKSNAEAALARARVTYAQDELQMRGQELTVASQVREVARTLNTARKRVDATRASRDLAQRRLEAEQKKFQAGMSTTFQVIQAQRDLASARNAELQAVLDYNRALVDFETVQEAPVSGGTISLASTAR